MNLIMSFVLNTFQGLLEKLATLETRFAELEQKYKSVSEAPQKDNNDEKGQVDEPIGPRVRSG